MCIGVDKSILYSIEESNKDNGTGIAKLLTHLENSGLLYFMGKNHEILNFPFTLAFQCKLFMSEQ